MSDSYITLKGKGVRGLATAVTLLVLSASVNSPSIIGFFHGPLQVGLMNFLELSLAGAAIWFAVLAWQSGGILSKTFCGLVILAGIFVGYLTVTIILTVVALHFVG